MDGHPENLYRIESSGEPALPAPVMLHIAIAAALSDTAQAQVEFLDIFVLPKHFGLAVEHDSTVFHDIAVLHDAEGHGGILFSEQNGHPLLTVQAHDDVEEVAVLVLPALAGHAGSNRRSRVDTERTLVLVKPDGVARGLVGEVISRIERKGLSLVALGNVVGNVLGGQLTDRLPTPQLVVATSMALAGARSVRDLDRSLVT